MLGRPHIPRLRPPIQSGPYTPDKPLSSFTVSAPARGCIYYGAIEREGEALGRLGKIRACDKARRRKAKHALRRARRECAEAIGRFDAFEAARDTLRGALECVDLATGELHRPEYVQALIEGVA